MPASIICLILSFILILEQRRESVRPSIPWWVILIYYEFIRCISEKNMEIFYQFSGWLQPWPPDWHGEGGAEGEAGRGRLQWGTQRADGPAGRGGLRLRLQSSHGNRGLPGPQPSRGQTHPLLRQGRPSGPWTLLLPLPKHSYQLKFHQGQCPDR